jgi:hypothetical protein
MPAVAAVGIYACPGFGPRGLRYRIRRHDAAGTGHPPSGPCGLTLQLEDRPLVKDLLTSGGRRGPVPGCSRCVVGRAGALVAACRAFGDGGARRRKVGRPFPGSVRAGPAGVLLAAVLVVALAADQITMSDRPSLPRVTARAAWPRSGDHRGAAGRSGGPAAAVPGERASIGSEVDPSRAADPGRRQGPRQPDRPARRSVRIPCPARVGCIARRRISRTTRSRCRCS